jgi:hypothetical protein
MIASPSLLLAECSTLQRRPVKMKAGFARHPFAQCIAFSIGDPAK